MQKKRLCCIILSFFLEQTFNVKKIVDKGVTIYVNIKFTYCGITK